MKTNGQKAKSTLLATLVVAGALLSSCVSTTNIRNTEFAQGDFNPGKAYLVATNSTIWKPGPAVKLQTAVLFKSAKVTYPLVSNENDNLIVLAVEPGELSSDLALYGWDVVRWMKLGSYGNQGGLKFLAEAGHFYFVGDFTSKASNNNVETSMARTQFVAKYSFPLDDAYQNSGGSGRPATREELVGHKFAGKHADKAISFEFGADGVLVYTVEGTSYQGKWSFDKSKPMLGYTLDWTEGDAKKGYLMNITRTKDGIAVSGYWYLTDAFITFDEKLVSHN